MAMSEVYSATTAPNPKSSCFMVPSEFLDMKRFILKIIQVLLSFLAFVLEELVNSCISCSALYFFEFVSCTAFLFTLLLLVLLSTTLHTRVGINIWGSVDFVYTGAIAVLFFISSIVLASNNGRSRLEISAVVFGFLAMLAFVIDFGFLLKDHRLPCKQGGNPESSKGGPAVAEAPAETEKLTPVANGAE